MNNDIFDNLDQIANNLYFSFSATNTEEVKQAMAFLTDLKNASIVLFAKALIQIAVSEKVEYEKVRGSALAILLASVQETIKRKVLEPQEKESLLEFILTGIYQPHIDIKLKLQLQDSLQELYKTDTGVEMRRKSLEVVQQKLQEGNLLDYCASYLVFQRIFKSPRFSKDIAMNFFNQTREALVETAKVIVDTITNDLASAAAAGFENNDQIRTIFDEFRILRIFVLTIKSVIHTLGTRKKLEGKNKLYSMYMGAILRYERVVEVMASILGIQVPSPKQIPDCLFSTSGVTSLDDVLNGIKGDVLLCFNKTFEFTHKFSKLLDPSKNAFFVFAQNVAVHGVIKSLLNFCENPELNFDQIDNGEETNTGLKDSLVESMLFLSYLSFNSDLYEIFTSVYQRLLLNVCIPFIMSTPREKKTFFDQPDEFFALASDACADQESKIIKTQAAHLLDSLVDNIDGVTSFITNILLAVIEYSIFDCPWEAIPEKYPTLDQYKNIVFIAKTDALTRFETSLFILASVSYNLAKRDDLLVSIEKLLQEYQDHFFGSDLHPIIRSRMCLFVGYFFEILFQKDSEAHFVGMQLNFLVDCITLDDPKDQAIVAQAVDSLSIIFVQPDLVSMIGPFIPALVERIANYIEVAKNKDYFDVIEVVFMTFKKRLFKNPKFIQILITKMVSRIIIECKDLAQRNEDQSLILDRIWNIFLLIAKDPQYINQYQVDIEKLMEPLEEFISGKHCYFEQDLLKYIATVTKVSNGVSPFCWSLLQLFPNLFVNNGQVLDDLFEPLNQIIMRGRDRFNESEINTIRAMIQMGILGLNPTLKKSTDADVCQAALLLQLVLQYMGGIPDDDWERMIQTCLDKLQTNQKVFVQVKISEVILCAFIVNFNYTYQIIQRHGAMKRLLEIYLDNAMSFEHAYDRKILMVGLCQLLGKGLSDRDIQDRIYQIFNVLVSYLKFSEHMDQINKKAEYSEDDKNAIPTRDILMQFMSMQDDEAFNQKPNLVHATMEQIQEGFEEEKKNEDGNDDDNEDNDNDYAGYTSDPDENETIRIVNKLESELFEKDEFSMFRETLYEVKAIDESILPGLLEWLPANKREYLREVIHAQRLVLTNSKGKTQSEARRVVKTARRKIRDVPTGGEEGEFFNQ